MPKGKRVAGARKKRLDKQKKMRTVDFVKTRRKLGKKLEKNNATKVGFSAARVHVASQKVGSRKEAVGSVRAATRLRTAKGVAVIRAELSHLGSSKWKSRQSVAQNIRKLLVDASETEDGSDALKLVRAAAVYLVRLFELIYDPSLAVRSSLHSCLSWLLSFLARRRSLASLLGPFSAQICTHLNAALSHADASIRSDALRVLHLFCNSDFIAHFGHSSLSRLLSNLNSILADDCEEHLVDCLAHAIRAFNSLSRAGSYHFREAAAVSALLCSTFADQQSDDWRVPVFDKCTVLLKEQYAANCESTHKSTLLLTVLDLSADAIAVAKVSDKRLDAAVKLATVKILPRMSGTASRLRLVSICLRLSISGECIGQCTHEWLRFLLSVLSDVRDNESFTVHILTQALRCIKLVAATQPLGVEQKEGVFGAVSRTLATAHVLERIRNSASVIPTAFRKEHSLTADAIVDRFLLHV